MPQTRHAFFLSDRTGITAESMGEALLSQFDSQSFIRSVHPFIDSPEKAHEMVGYINEAAEHSLLRPLVFSSIANDSIHAIITDSAGLHLSFFAAFINDLEKELGTVAKRSPGHIHGINDTERYDARMEAVNFSLNHDDGISDKNLKDADVILMGVSRSGKTPTCLYLALQYGIRAANYPLTPEDLEQFGLPRMLKPFKNKLYGLTIDPERLHHIRSERLPDSDYASLSNCQREVRDAERLMRQHRIAHTNTTHKSVEELAANIIQNNRLKRRS
ncbi:kinase/pyrophosphorylase [Suttonella sp. R2A3]|uniref:posphoenolpyruvate synthetase regulatory kinase/phosphorylase PpsR n=1 Tax=Suttonella sp. R2A3 TaxID=2908648 RepID=UPI001F1C98E9|nr:pyruvate, water dikinase regulatory protein [Suttonella sp. R2A3]UJF24398.1 kinase/pyrophosphorylase [Suttonella sp. R2A3]